MAVFENREKMYEIFGKCLERSFAEGDISEKLHEADIVMRFKYNAPEGSLVIDCSALPIKWGFDLDYEKVDVDFSLSGDTAHSFFLGELNVPMAIARRKIVFKGSIAKSLKLLPAMRPMHAIYKSILEGAGMEDSAGSAQEQEVSAPAVEQPLPGTESGPAPNAVEEAVAAANVAFRSADIPLTESVRLEKAPDIHPEREESPELYLDMLEKMALIREFETHLEKSFADGSLPTFAVHLSIGQEAIAAGACMALRGDDVINTTHRGHGHLIAKGTDLGKMMAELFGKSDGTCGGRGGSMHVIDRSIGIMGSNGIVGAGAVLGAGAGMASKLLGKDSVSVVFFGDGATNQGMFHEGLNFAAVKKLPVVFIIENNLYGEFTSVADHSGITELWKRAESYGIPGVRADGNDALEVFRTVRKAVHRARAGEGPSLIEFATYRWHGHMEGDQEEYRTEQEKNEWKEKCPIRRLRDKLESDGTLAAGEYMKLLGKTKAAVEEARRFADESALPGADEIYRHVYATDWKECHTGPMAPAKTDRHITASQAINETLAEEMRRDPTVMLLGEDVSLGGYFQVTGGLVDEFGKERVMDTPISENAILGAAAGAAAEGLRPVAEILFSDFITVCMDPLINQAAKMSFMSGGQVKVPMVVRMPSGSGIGMAAQHSQNLETKLAGIPGLIVAAPSDAHTSAGLLRSAIRSENPVIIVEHKLLYIDMGPIEDGALTPLCKSRVVREGRDATLVSYSLMTGHCLRAAKILAGRGIEAEVVDLLTLYPMDIEPVLRSVAKTGRLLVVEEGPMSMGVGAEVIARVAQCGWNFLKKAPARLAGKEAPIAYSAPLERAIPPSEDDIVKACAKLC